MTQIMTTATCNNPDCREPHEAGEPSMLADRILEVYRYLEYVLEEHAHLRENDGAHPLGFAVYDAAYAAQGRLAGALALLEGEQSLEDNPAPFEKEAQGKNQTPPDGIPAG